MNIFDSVLQSIEIYGVGDGYISQNIDGTGPRCLNGHVAGSHGLLVQDKVLDSGVLVQRHLIDEVGNIVPKWLATASEKEAADQYHAECQLLARIIVEQYEDVLIRELGKYNKSPVAVSQQKFRTDWWELFPAFSIEEAIEMYPHDIIACFNDNSDVTKDDIVRVVEKARAQV